MPEVAEVVQRRGMLIDGHWIEEGASSEIKSPYDGSRVGVVTLAGPRQIEQAIVAAVRAFQLTRKMPVFERQRILRNISAKIAERREQFARTMALDPKTHNVYLVTAQFEPPPAGATGEGGRPPRPRMVPDTFELIVVGTGK